jgi:hypothetical protein
MPQEVTRRHFMFQTMGVIGGATVSGDLLPLLAEAAKCKQVLRVAVVRLLEQRARHRHRRGCEDRIPPFLSWNQRRPRSPVVDVVLPRGGAHPDDGRVYFARRRSECPYRAVVRRLSVPRAPVPSLV